MSAAHGPTHIHRLAATAVGLVLMDMPLAAQRSRDHLLQTARLAGAALARKAAS